ncbi:DNA/RNA non-specific endonuclease [Lactococcus garvieae]|uniref:DNA/RNA non-specific endonuclease n=1 Tax=Lactococcus garvieae TaxID=1363 RepID=UPI00324C705E
MKKHKLKTLIAISGLVLTGGVSLFQAKNPELLQRFTHQPSRFKGSSSQATVQSSKTPSQTLAQSVLSDAIKEQLKGKIEYKGSGAFVINGNKTDLNAQVNSSPYVQLTKVDSEGRAGLANSLLNKSSRQYKDRTETRSNGKSNSTQMDPVGWHQMKLKSGSYSTLYNRGHSIAYALAGSIKGFDASEANPQNITTQTSWANQANGKTNTGQNYYEGLVRKALDKNQTVRYRVEPLYEGDNLVPSGTHLEAKSKDGSLEFNVFVPNVQPGMTIDYKTGFGTVKK